VRTPSHALPRARHSMRARPRETGAPPLRGGRHVSLGRMARRRARTGRPASQVTDDMPPPLPASVSMRSSSASSKRASPHGSQQRRSPAATSGATVRNRHSATPASRSIRLIGHDEAARIRPRPGPDDTSSRSRAIKAPPDPTFPARLPDPEWKGGVFGCCASQRYGSSGFGCARWRMRRSNSRRMWRRARCSARRPLDGRMVTRAPVRRSGTLWAMVFCLPHSQNARDASPWLSPGSRTRRRKTDPDVPPRAGSSDRARGA
jgi:hypothetical protein